MKKLPLLLTACLFFDLVYSQDTPSEVPEPNFYTFYNDVMDEENSAFNQADRKRMDRAGQIWNERLYPSGDPRGAHKSFSDYTNAFNNNSITQTSHHWSNINPMEGQYDNLWSGRMTRITYSPFFDGITNQNVWSCSSHGGLWKSDDNGESWSNTNADSQIPTCAIADIAISHQNESNMIIATGFSDDALPRSVDANVGFINPQYTAGIYRSTDGGNSWEAINGPFSIDPVNGVIHEEGSFFYHENEYIQQFGGFTCRRIMINPIDQNEVWVATSSGVYRSTNAFEIEPTWQLISDSNIDALFETNATNFRGICPKPDNSDIWYMSAESIYKSTRYEGEDEQFEDMLTEEFGFDRTTFELNNGEILQINISTSAVRPDWLYAYIISDHPYTCDGTMTENPFLEGTILFYNGISWIELYDFIAYDFMDDCNDGVGEPQNLVRKDWHAFDVSDINPDLIIFGNTRVHGSVDNDIFNVILDSNPTAMNFETKSAYATAKIHADCHDLKFEPNNAQNHFLAANDGGICKKTVFSGEVDWQRKNEGLNCHIIWSFDDSDYNDKIIIQGHQDNGVYAISPALNNGDWHSLSSQDGYGARIDDFYKHFYSLDNEEFGIKQQRFVPTAEGFITGIGQNTGIGETDTKYFDHEDVGTSDELGQKMPLDNGFMDRKTNLAKTFQLLNPQDGKPVIGFCELYQKLIFWPEPEPAADWLGGLENSYNWSEPLSDLRNQPVYGTDSDENYDEKKKRLITEMAISENDPNYVFIATYAELSNSSDFGIPSWPPLFCISETGYGNSVLEGGDPVFTNYMDYLPEYNYNGEISNPVITGIAVSPKDPKKVWLTFSGFDKEVKVWSTVNPNSPDAPSSFEQWYNFDPNGSLQNLPVNGIVYQDGTDDNLFIATDAGVWMKNKWMDEWVKYGDMPGIRVTELKINRCSNKLRASTFGRGILEVDIPEGRHLSNTREISEDTTWDEGWMYEGTDFGSFFGTPGVLGWNTFTPEQQASIQQDHSMYSSMNILIKNGATLTLNVDLYMPAKGYIRVEPGAKLIVNDGVRITNLCGALWGGIEVWGQDDLSQTDSNQGVCELNNCIIENAHTGVWLRKNDDECNYVSGSGGGIVKAKGVQFLNCYIGAEFGPYRWTTGLGNPFPNKSYFTQCEFKADQVINGGFDFKYGIHLDHVNAVQISSCNFEFAAPESIENNGLPQPTAIGIKSSNAMFKLGAVCSADAIIPDEDCPESDLFRSVFTNLKYGIYASHEDNENLISVENADFNICSYGIKARGVSNATISKNTFDISPVSFALGTGNVVPYGLHLQGCTAYEVEDNFFRSNNNEVERLGLVITDSNIDIYDNDPNGETEGAANRVYRNHFDKLHCGTLIQGKNSNAPEGSDLTGGVGLEIRCGKYGEEDNNMFHIALTNEAEVQLQQGTDFIFSPYGAGNVFFTQNTSNEGNLFVNDDGSKGYMYFHYNEFNHIPSEGSYSIIPEIQIENLQIGITDFESVCPVNSAGSSTNIEIIKDKYVAEKTKQFNVSTEITETIDGGETSTLISAIQNLNNSSYQIRNTLYHYSPYLSPDVFQALMTRPEPINEWHLTDLLIANSPLELSTLELYYQHEPVGDFYHNLIMLYQIGGSQIDGLKNEKRKAISEKQIAKSKYYKKIMLDFSEALAESESIEEVMETSTVAADLHLQFTRYLDTDNYTQAQALLDDYPITEEKDGFKTIGQIILNRAQNNIILQSLTAEEVDELTEIAESRKSGKYTAQSLLENLNGITSEEIIVLPQLTRNAVQLADEANEETDLEFFNIYPNPATDVAYLTFKLPETLEKASVEIYNVEGKLIESIDLSSKINISELNLNKYKSGQYVASFIVNDMLIKTVKFNVLK